MKDIITVLIILSSITAFNSSYATVQSADHANPMVSGMNLTEQGTHLYDAAADGKPKLEAQLAVDELKSMGAHHVILTPRATMTNPKGNDIVPIISAAQRSEERNRYKRLIDYIHGQGMTVGIRPIFFVVKPDGTFPYREQQPDGKMKIWWHGNIQPSDPNRWFDSFKAYLDIYLLITKLNHVEEFTLGAELYSMTVGIEDQWKAFPYGFPGQWLNLLHYARKKLDATTRIMYDINFTDDVSDSGGLSASGGEFERWRYRLVDLAHPTKPDELVIWNDLVSFWKELDAVGIDMYRSLASPQDTIPGEYDSLVKFLRIRSDEFANQMDTTMASIEAVTGMHQFAYFKETGFRSIDNGFIDPFDYETGTGHYNPLHQAAAYQAIFESFWAPHFDWFGGGAFWDTGVDPGRNLGIGDTGFSPIGKIETTRVIQNIFQFKF